jgi:Predicted choline kinase involved in LPS biosynthesis
MEIEELVQQKLRLVFNDNSLIFDKSRFAGGLTNYNYIMNIRGIDYVIRQPGGMTEQIIDRKAERINSTIASEFGVNSESIYFDEESGIKISVYIQNSRNVAQADPCSLMILKTISCLMKKIHKSPKHFANVFNWEAELTKYEQIVRQLRGGFFFDYSLLKDQLIRFMRKSIKNSILVPCHNDTVPENFVINDEGNIYLIDWEYAGMNDPGWDVAAYILESGLTAEAIHFLTADYYGQMLNDNDILKIKCYMMAQDLLWTVWALIRHYNGDDFLEYCRIRYERFRKNIKAMVASSDYPISEMVKSKPR